MNKQPEALHILEDFQIQCTGCCNVSTSDPQLRALVQKQRGEVQYLWQQHQTERADLAHRHKDELTRYVATKQFQ